MSIRASRVELTAHHNQLLWFCSNGQPLEMSQLTRNRIYAGHKELSHILDTMGEDGYSLPEAAESVFDIWFRYGAIQPVFLDSWMHLAIKNEASPLPNWLK